MYLLVRARWGEWELTKSFTPHFARAKNVGHHFVGVCLLLQCALQWCSVCCSVAVRVCSVLQCISAKNIGHHFIWVCCTIPLQCVLQCALQCVVQCCSVCCRVVCCSVLQCVAVCCSVLQRVTHWEVIRHVNGSSHMWMSHVTHAWVRHMYPESCHTWMSMSHMNE